MNWINETIERIPIPCGYRNGDKPSAEPTAMAALALLGAHRRTEADAAIRWLGSIQQSEGSVASHAEISWPGWPTPQAMLAAALARGSSYDSPLFDLAEAQTWLLTMKGKQLETTSDVGHDVRLVGWPWVEGTHSWQEPTAWSVLALKAVGLGNHPRTREGVQMLVDRLLSTGGCNYGNTIVLGQRLRPHVEPTGLALLALAGEAIADPRIERSVNYLESVLSSETTAMSLAYGLLGLTAYGRRPAAADLWLEEAYRRVVERGGPPFELALLVLAAQGDDCPLISFVEEKQTSRR